MHIYRPAPPAPRFTDDTGVLVRQRLASRASTRANPSALSRLSAVSLVVAAAVALVVSLTSPSDAGIVSREQVTPWLTRYVVEGTSTDLPNDPNVIRISARDVVTLTVTLIPSPLSPHGAAFARFYGGCIVILHPFAPYIPCENPPAYPSPGSTTTFGPPLVVADPYVPQVHGYQGLGTAGRLAYDVSPGATAIIEVGVNAPLPPFFTTEEKEEASRNVAGTTIVGGAIAGCAIFPQCQKLAKILTVAVGWLALSQILIANDPVDPNFSAITQVSLPVPDPPTGIDLDDAAHALATGLHLVRAYTDAALTSANRALGAFIAGDAFWYQEQLSALNRYKVQAKQAQAALPALLQATSAAVSGEPAITIAQAQTALQNLLTHGFPPDDLLQFAQAGLMPAQIEQIRLLIGTRNPALIGGMSLAALLVRPDIVEALRGSPAVSLRVPIHGCWSVAEWFAQPTSCPLIPQTGLGDPLPLQVTFVYLGGDDADASYPITAANFPPVASYSNGSRVYCTLLDANGDGRLDAICDYYHDLR
jgi:hypothetical protein